MVCVYTIRYLSCNILYQVVTVLVYFPYLTEQTVIFVCMIILILAGSCKCLHFIRPFQF